MTELSEPVSEHKPADLLRVLRKHRWLIIGVFLLTVVTVSVWTSQQIPIFRAAATILIDPEAPKFVSFQEVTPMGASAPWDPNYYPTQYEIIRSRPVLEMAVQALRQKQRPPEVASQLLASSVAVEPRRNTRLVMIAVEHPEPALAAEFANTVAAAYAQYNLQLKMTGASEALSWLTEEAGRLRAKVQESAVALQNYRVKAGILGLEEQRKITAQKIMDQNKAYLEAQAQRLAIEARLQQLAEATKQSGRDQVMLTGSATAFMEKLRSEIADLEVERSKLLKVYKGKHPEILKVEARIDQTRQALDGEIQTILRGVQNEHRLAKAREDTLLATVNQMRREGQELNEKEIQYLALQRESETSQQLYDTVAKRLKETGVTGGLETNNIRLVEAATAPTAPVRPRTIWNIAVSVVAGLGLGIALAFAIEFFDKTLRTPDDVEQHLGLPVIAIIPKFASKP
jgi:polysaccharide biosynthesis transport protein